MYICFKACRDNFFKYGLIIGFDGCFLKGYYGGKILAAIGRDPNDQNLPIEFFVLEGEIKYSWSWFLELLIIDLGGEWLCKNYTFISDQQKVTFSVLFEVNLIVWVNLKLIWLIELIVIFVKWGNECCVLLCFTFGNETEFFLCFTLVMIFFYTRASKYDYEVRHISFNGEKYIVSLLKKECTCRRWMLTGLP